MFRARLLCISVAIFWLGQVTGYPASDFLDRLSRFLQDEKTLQKRGAANIVQQVTMFDENGNAKTVSVKEACLKAHNDVRALHQGTPALKHDDALAKEAANWALDIASSKNFRHSNTKNGENIYYQAVMSNIGPPGQPPVLSPAHAVFAWYQESWEVNGRPQAYNYNSEQNPGTGHFTQIVWKETTKVGCGVATFEEPNPSNPSFKMSNTYIVAQYQKPGNMMGDFVKNVKPLKGGARHPESAGELEVVGGCVNYGPGCDQYGSMCNMVQGFCGCTCSRR